MSKNPWNEITREDVLKAICLFEAEHPIHPEARSTFLVFHGKRYPAKHIRGMAYQIHFGREIQKGEYSGGLDTVRFFEKLGFEMHYTHRSINTHSVTKGPETGYVGNKNQKILLPDSASKCKETPKPVFDPGRVTIPSKGVIEQKNALQLLLNRMFYGDVVCEKTFSWMKTPAEITGEYALLYHRLSAYRGDKNFAKRNVTLRCDFVCENSKLIIEYDERQHFSEARKISLLAYPDVPLHYDRELWISACQDIQAKDNYPVNRDEVRAFYDSTRDIEAAKHGYTLVRIMHGQIDFQSANAYKKLAELLDAAMRVNSEPEVLRTPDLNSCTEIVTAKEPIKIGLYLQTNELFGNRKIFKKAMDAVRTSDIDILVFPEFSYVPFVEAFYSADIRFSDSIQYLYDRVLELSRYLGRAVVICNEDKQGAIVCIYANSFAEETETKCKHYIKHTMTNFSACDVVGYREMAESIFQPILYKGYRIGLTICYDCNHAIFSRKYGQNGVDIILNCTGGNVVYGKWFKYNKVRAIENGCFTFVTMGGDGTMINPHNYVYGFTPSGKEMIPTLLNGKYTGKKNISGGIYVYDTADDNGSAEPDSSVNQAESPNKMSDLDIPVDGVDNFLHSAKTLTDKIYVLHHRTVNVILCLIDGADILRPEKVLKLLYAEVLKPICNKRYIIINRWDKVDLGFYETTLSVVLKVRSMENYCAVVLESGNLKKCYQCGQNRTAQVVKAENNHWGIDLRRTGGPETIWRNKSGMKESWRDNVEWLIGTM